VYIWNRKICDKPSYPNFLKDLISFLLRVLIGTVHMNHIIRVVNGLGKVEAQLEIGR